MKLRLTKAALGALLLLLPACEQPPTDGPTTSAEEIFELCASCHGSRGEGKKSINAPAIAGLSEWYVQSQLKKFRSGLRGTHPADVTGMQMRPMAISLRSDADIALVSKYVASLEHVNPAPTLEGGRAETGAALFGPCVTCHGPKAQGNLDRKAPPLTHTNDWYLFTQLEKFKGKVRGSNSDDGDAAQMLPWMATLPDEQAMKDVIAHIQTLR